MNRPAGSRLEAAFAPVVVLVAVMSAWCGTARDADTNQPLWTAPASAVPLQVVVRFTGTQFVIENRSMSIWRDVLVRVARTGDPPPYQYTADAILGDRSVTVGALNFARPNNMRLSPFRLQPDRWAVTARFDDGRVGFAEGRFDASASP